MPRGPNTRTTSWCRRSSAWPRAARGSDSAHRTPRGGWIETGGGGGGGGPRLGGGAGGGGRPGRGGRGRRPRPRGARRYAWCSRRGSTSAGSGSTPGAGVGRRGSWRRTRAGRCSSTGTRSGGRFASRGRWCRSATPSRRSISGRGRAEGRSRRGPRRATSVGAV
jgi:hypothetical protein